MQESHYYPFGSKFAGPDNSYQAGLENNYLYNGKELENFKGLNWYDYGARFYDPQIGRWHVQDPLAEAYYSYTPYNYVMNNPMNMIDPDGRFALSTHIDKKGNVISEQDDGDDGVYVHQGNRDEAKNSFMENYSSSNTSAGGIHIGDLGGEIDMSKTSLFKYKLTESTNMALNSGFNILDWVNNVKGKGVWDLKGNTKTIWGVAWEHDLSNGSDESRYTNFVFKALRFSSAADVGNYHAGWTGVMTGVPTWMQVIGAGVIEQKKDISQGNLKQVLMQYLNQTKTFMDEVDDARWNKQGMSDALEIKKQLGIKK